MSEWQPIETAPKDSSRVLVWMEPLPDPYATYREGNMAVIASYVAFSDALKREGMTDGWSWYGPERCYPTHWMPLPPPPSSGLESSSEHPAKHEQNQ